MIPKSTVKTLYVRREDIHTYSPLAHIQQTMLEDLDVFDYITGQSNPSSTVLAATSVKVIISTSASMPTSPTAVQHPESSPTWKKAMQQRSGSPICLARSVTSPIPRCCQRAKHSPSRTIAFPSIRKSTRKYWMSQEFPRLSLTTRRCDPTWSSSANSSRPSFSASSFNE